MWKTGLRRGFGGVGVQVSKTPALRPCRTILEGQHVSLVPLEAEHAADLYPVLGKSEHAGLWTYMFDGPWDSSHQFQDSIMQKSRSQDPLFFTVVDHGSTETAGYASLMRIEPAHRVVEVGNIMFSPTLQRSRAATETMYLMAKHVFEDLGYRRYEWKCDNFNLPSKRAAERLGFTFEGIFRQHMIYKGRNRDTAWYSMLDSEWTDIKAGFKLWLDDTNFDEDGRQIKGLRECRSTNVKAKL